ncbi:MAG: polymer-forming cytoskeletal protein [Bradymonadaceae bacterium]
MAASEDCTIGAGVAVDGRITGDADVTVEGQVEGTVELDGELIVAPDGEVFADVEVESATVEGRLDGDLLARDTVQLREGANVTGTIRTPRLDVEEGARVEGNIDMDVELPALE